MANLAVPAVCLAFLVFAFQSSLGGASSSSLSLNTDLEGLMAFKAASDAGNLKLGSWNASLDPCSWPGVWCLRRRVYRLVLENLDLDGEINPLTTLTELRVLSLKLNHFFGPIPDLSNLTALKMLFLSHNQFSGDFPFSVPSLTRLYRLDLSHNNFSGQIPALLSRLAHLLTLRLDANRFAGPIPAFELPNLQEFNVSVNLLAGEVPKTLARFPVSVFEGNVALCGAPLRDCYDHGDNGALASPVAGSPTTVSSSPTRMPEKSSHRRSGNRRPNVFEVVAIVIGDILLLCVISLFIYWYFWRSYAAEGGKASRRLEGEKIGFSPSSFPSAQPERGRMVFFEGAKRFELEDLLRASAEMLGKGAMGTAYKAVLDDGAVVAVKRLRDAQAGGGGSKRAVEQQMDVLGRLRHPNVVSLRAYYYAREEKLLVYDYMPSGSLFWLLHGNRGPGRTPLHWAARMKIAAGAARGLAFIHRSSGGPLGLTHGNIKSTNLLLDASGAARLSDFGLAALAPTAAAVRSNGYLAPEAAASPAGKVSHESDVYSFGILLLELLTGKCPSAVDPAAVQCGGFGAVPASSVDLSRWVQSVVREEWTAEVFDLELMRDKDIEEEMVGLLQIAISCTSVTPEHRPKMSQVVKMMEEIRGGDEASPSRETFGSVSDSPDVSEDAVIPGNQ